MSAITKRSQNAGNNGKVKQVGYLSFEHVLSGHKRATRPNRILPFRQRQKDKEKKKCREIANWNKKEQDATGIMCNLRIT